VFRRDVPERPHHPAAAILRGPYLVEAARYPYPLPVAADERDGEAALAVRHQALEALAEHPVPLGVVLLVRPPWPRRGERQLLRAEPHDVGEGGVDLHHGAVLVEHEERLVQRVEQGRAPAGVVAAQPRELHVGPDPGQQFGRGERLDEVIVRASLQTLDRRLLPGPCGQQQYRDLRRARVRAQRRDQLKAAEAGHHHVAEKDVRRVQAGGLQRGLPVGHGGDLVAGPQQPLQVLAHVRVVVRQQHAGRRGLTQPGSARQRPDRTLRSGLIARQPAHRLEQELAGGGRHHGRPVPGDHVRLRQVPVTERDPDRERGAHPPVALRGDRAPVQPDQLPDQGQPDTAALVGPGRDVLDPVEPVEQAGYLRRGDPTPVSATRSTACPSSSPSRTLTVPEKVNFSALLSRLKTTFSHISRST
jgi:hypothetical protein